MLPSVRDNLPLYIGLRYGFSRQDNRFIGVVSMVSLVGMALGVASLITVLSVMNGFAAELRGRILSLVPHVQVESALPIEDWAALRSRLLQQPGVTAAAPYIHSKGLLTAAGEVRGTAIAAIDPQAEAELSDLAGFMRLGSFASLDRERYGIVLGALQARALGVGVGDRVDLTIPRLTVTPLGSFPRSKRFTVVGVFEVGAQLDGQQAYIALEAGQRLFALGDAVSGLRVELDDLYAAPERAAALQDVLGTDFRVRDWGQSQGNLFAAIRMEKTMMTVLLMSVVAVAAFNIISTLTMAVTEKRADIAVLRTLGASARSVMAIFMSQGLVLAGVGIAAGAAVGVLLSLNISAVTLAMEQLTGTKLFSPDVYFISDLPAVLQWADVLRVALLALILSVLATLVPAWRASRIAPAEVLRSE
ncbi:MAG: lipoprotein-releasing ABC transporter permease subunit [Halieaceae bacterium]|nr:lipoprotein-releasing ABC transporter permease subunit [Halieaceae bacterium]